MANKEYTPNYRIPSSEFTEDAGCVVLFSAHGLNIGRMISASKSEYCKEHQDNLIIFNANVLTKSHGKIWYGDLDITEDFDKLKNIADILKEDLYILMEGDARFGYEKQSLDILLPKARVIIKCKDCGQNIKQKKTKSTKTKKDGNNNRSTK